MAIKPRKMSAHDIVDGWVDSVHSRFAYRGLRH
jgi:hypothetical protein